MRYDILNRDEKNKIPFRESLYELVKTKGEKLILGYGYLESDAIDDDFIKAIEKGFENITVPKVILIGTNQETIRFPRNSAEQYKAYISKYLEFAFKIKNKINRCIIEIYISKSKNYHKKLAIKFKDNEPIIAIIGSSNISRNTFATNSNYFNQEVDILFWDSWKYNRIIETSSLKEFYRRDIYKDNIKSLKAKIIEQLTGANDYSCFHIILIAYIESNKIDEFIECFRSYVSQNMIEDNTLINSFISELDSIFKKLSIIKESSIENLLEEFKIEYNINCEIKEKIKTLANEIYENEDLEYFNLYITEEKHQELIKRCNYFRDTNRKDIDLVKKNFLSLIRRGRYIPFVLNKIDNMYISDYRFQWLLGEQRTIKDENYMRIKEILCENKQT